MSVSINTDEGEERLPSGGTCGNYIGFPAYSTDEMMSSKLLTAIRLCGEIDNDGSGYGSEDESEHGGDGEERGVEAYSDDRQIEVQNWALNDEEEGNQGEYDSESDDDEEAERSGEEQKEREGGLEGLDAGYAF